MSDPIKIVTPAAPPSLSDDDLRRARDKAAEIINLTRPPGSYVEVPKFNHAIETK
jgi:hypothetical protein